VDFGTQSKRIAIGTCDWRRPLKSCSPVKSSHASMLKPYTSADLVIFPSSRSSAGIYLMHHTCASDIQLNRSAHCSEEITADLVCMVPSSIHHQDTARPVQAEYVSCSKNSSKFLCSKPSTCLADALVTDLHMDSYGDLFLCAVIQVMAYARLARQAVGWAARHASQDSRSSAKSGG